MRRANKVRLARRQRDEAKARWRHMVDLHDEMVLAGMADQLGAILPPTGGAPRPRPPGPDPGHIEGASELRQLRHEIRFYSDLADKAAEKLGELILNG